MKKAALALIRFYQRYISPIKGPCCRFIPTCSEYAAQAIQKFGMIRGGYLALKRILRCNPLCPGGYDPVPDEYPKKGRKKMFSHRKTEGKK